MTYPSFSESLPNFLRQPTWIATIVSISFHGVLGLSLPLNSSQSPAPAEAVDLVELSAVEQNRLPLLSNVPSIPQLSQTDLFSSLPPLSSTDIPLPPVTSSELPPLLDQTKFEIVPPPDLQAFGWPLTEPPAQKTPLNFPLVDLSKPILPPAPTEVPVNPLIEMPPKSPPLGDLRALDANPLPPQLTSEEWAALQQELTPVDSGKPPANQPQSPPATQQIPPEELAQQQRLQEQQQQRDADRLGGTVAIKPNLQPSPEASPTEQPTAAATPSAAEQPEQPKVNPEIAKAYADNQAMRAKIAYNAAGTTPEDASKSLETWLLDVRKASGKDDLVWESKKLEIGAAYPKLGCLNKLEGKVLVGVLVDPDGKIVGEPQLIQSSGYQVFNETALESAQNQEFEATGEYKAYPVDVKFEYDENTCAGTPSTEATVSQG